MLAACCARSAMYEPGDQATLRLERFRVRLFVDCTKLTPSGKRKAAVREFLQIAGVTSNPPCCLREFLIHAFDRKRCHPLAGRSAALSYRLRWSIRCSSLVGHPIQLRRWMNSGGEGWAVLPIADVLLVCAVVAYDKAAAITRHMDGKPAAGQGECLTAVHEHFPH